jgi:DNA-binding transcriptional MerR regulator/methylmalonyl-CoA mutase cobalamin-binding subunit
MISIGVVARQTGIAPARLRKWESRYGFPQPLRHPSGQRYYRSEDLAMLKRIVLRLASGERIGRIMESLERPSADTGLIIAGAQERPEVAEALSSLLRKDLVGFAQQLEQQSQCHHVRAFIEQFAAPLSQAVGDSWAQGHLPIYAEHLFSAQMEALLMRMIARHPSATHPALLLATPAGEKHTLGLTMTQALLAEVGVPSMRLHADLPSEEIAAATREHGFNTIGLSASLSYPPRLLQAFVVKLRQDLPAEVALWVGGGGIYQLREIPDGCRLFADLDELLQAAVELRA